MNVRQILERIDIARKNEREKVLDELDMWFATYPNRPITPKIIHDKIEELRGERK